MTGHRESEEGTAETLQEGAGITRALIPKFHTKVRGMSCIPSLKNKRTEGRGGRQPKRRSRVKETKRLK
jgi:hypothetical protein